MKIEEVISMIARLHDGQWYGNAPFVVHPLLVARRFTEPTLQIVALLHDAVEDTPITLKEITSWFGAEVGEAIDALTRREGEDYLSAYIPRVARNTLARKVKIVDLQENLFSAKYFYPDRYGSLIKRYERAHRYLSREDARQIDGKGD
jgi:GTP pyrophosphokinase